MHTLFISFGVLLCICTEINHINQGNQLTQNVCTLVDMFFNYVVFIFVKECTNTFDMHQTAYGPCSLETVCIVKSVRQTSAIFRFS